MVPHLGGWRGRRGRRSRFAALGLWEGSGQAMKTARRGDYRIFDHGDFNVD
jgi:hypothetical protein